MVKRNRKGFTIIEVVLVLAIAGLIFAMVFIALPSLQRGQRNTERKRDLSLIVSAMNTWYRNNKSSVSDNFSKRDQINGFCTFYNRYVGEEVKDPSTGEAYKAALWGSTYAVDCTNNKTYNRGTYDPAVVGSATGGVDSDNWPKMEYGDLQYDDGAYCRDDVFIDDIQNGRYSGYKIFAFRLLLEGGAATCLDNGYSFSVLPYGHTIYQFGYIFDTGL